MEHTIGIKPEHLAKTAEFLTILLADEFLLYTKTKNAHWNIQGPDFYDKHKFFEIQYEQLDDIMDALAERIRTLGHYAVATLKRFLQLTHLSEESGQKNDSRGLITELLADHESIIVHLRENISRFTNDFHDPAPVILLQEFWKVTKKRPGCCGNI